MKYRLFSTLIVLALMLSIVGVAPAGAAAYGTAFVTSITYQNIGSEPAVITVDFYDEESASPLSITLASLPVGAGS